MTNLSSLLPFILSISLLFSSPLTALINSASEALEIAPKLIAEGAHLEELLEDHQSIQFVIAGVGLRSLVPNYTQSEEAPNMKLSRSSFHAIDSDTEETGSDSDFDSENEDISPTKLYISSLKTILKSIKNPDQISQIFEFDFKSQDLHQFVAQKEAEAQNILLKAVPIVSNIQKLLKIADGTPTTLLNIKFLTKLAKEIDVMNDELDEIESSSSDLNSKKESKRVKAKRAISESQAKIFKITQKLGDKLSSS